MTRATRIRVLSAAGALSFGGSLHLLVPDPAQRAGWGIPIVLSLGYGHLLSAAIFSWQRTQNARPDGVGSGLWNLFLLSSLLALLGGYALLADGAWLFLLLLTLSIWHTVENDLALNGARGLRLGGRGRIEDALAAVGLTALLLCGAAACASSGERALFEGSQVGLLVSPSVARGARGLALLSGLGLLVSRKRRLVGIGLVVAAALLPQDFSSWLSFTDFFVYSILYHVLTWLILSLDRWRQLRDRGRSEEASAFANRLTRIHLLVSAPCLIVAMAPQTSGAAGSVVLAPEFYLFWSALHVVHTLWLREDSGRARILRGPRGNVPSEFRESVYDG